MNIEQMREAFEAWCKEELSDDLSRHRLGGYEAEDVHHAWCAWQAASAATQRDAMAVAEAVREECAKRWHRHGDRNDDVNLAAIVEAVRPADERLASEMKLSQFLASKVQTLESEIAKMNAQHQGEPVAVAARIEELDRINRMAACGTVQNWLALPDEDKAKWFALMLKRDGERCKRIRELEAQLNAAILARREAQAETQQAREERNRSGIEARRGMFKLIGEARLEGWQAAREQAATMCDGHATERWNLYKGRPPYTGSEDGRAHPQIQGESIGAEFCADAIPAMQPPAEWQCAEVAPICGAAPNVEWKHEDGFGGGLTERNQDA